MPTIARLGPCRFFFYANDRGEPPHVQVERDRRIAKFWLLPPRLQTNAGFGRAEIVRLRAIVGAHRSKFLTSWINYFGS